MRKNWLIRKAVPQDSKGLQYCMELAYAFYQDRLGGKRLPPMDVDYSLEIRDYPTWIAELNGNIVGGLIMIFEESYASIANISVHPELQGKGLGAELMQYAEKMAKEKGYIELRLATHVLLNENISWYIHLGWIEISRDDVRVYMSKKII